MRTNGLRFGQSFAKIYDGRPARLKRHSGVRTAASQVAVEISRVAPVFTHWVNQTKIGKRLEPTDPLFYIGTDYEGTDQEAIMGAFLDRLEPSVQDVFKREGIWSDFIINTDEYGDDPRQITEDLEQVKEYFREDRRRPFRGILVHCDGTMKPFEEPVSKSESPSG
jgi:hypothetical protein